MSKRLRVALLAPPWLPVPPKGYGGIELVIENIAKGLLKAGVEVEVFGNGESRLRGIKVHSLFKSSQFEHIHKPWYEALPLLQAHMQFAVNKIQADGNFDIIHDHNPLFGTMFLSLATQLKAMPPALHTFHGPPFTADEKLKLGAPDNRLMLEQLKNPGKLYFVCISEAMKRLAPRQIQDHILTSVHNAINVNDFQFSAQKKDYYMTLGRFCPDKSQDVAAKLCAKLNKRLRMAGTVAGIGTNRKLLFELANPMSSFRGAEEFRYYSDKVFPYTINYPKITYVGNIGGKRKLSFIAGAKALLFPIDWEEPFGMAVIEALASGTPVVAMKRGAMSEIIQHGKTGFLADNQKQFEDYMQRVDEIDPYECRRSVEQVFSVETMTDNYVQRYKEIIKRSRA